jgi:peptidase inhibitor family I36
VQGRIRIVAGAAAFALTLAVGGAAVGGAERTLIASCPTATLCLYSGQDYAGKRVKIDEPGLSNVPDRLNNKASSFYNRRAKIVVLFAGRNGNGDSLCYSPQFQNPSLAFDSFGDRVSSVRLSRNATTCPT